MQVSRPPLWVDEIHDCGKHNFSIVLQKGSQSLFNERTCCRFKKKGKRNVAKTQKSLGRCVIIAAFHVFHKNDPLFSVSGDSYRKCIHIWSVMLYHFEKGWSASGYFMISANFSAVKQPTKAKLKGGSRSSYPSHEDKSRRRIGWLGGCHKEWTAFKNQQLHIALLRPQNHMLSRNNCESAQEKRAMKFLSKIVIAFVEKFYSKSCSTYAPT